LPLKNSRSAPLFFSSKSKSGVAADKTFLRRASLAAGMASPWLAAGLAVPALFLLGGGKDKDGKGKKGGGSMVDLDEFDR